MCSDNLVHETEANQSKTLTSLTWNCENIKNNVFCLKDVLYSKFPADLVFLSEPNIFQHDLKVTLSQVNSKYCSFLNSDDLHDSELAMTTSRTVGGTMVLWSIYLDPYVTIHPPTTSSYTAMILQLPGHQVTIHVALYLPTSGKDHDFIAEITNLRICLAELTDLYPRAAIFIRGDSNVNKNNKNRVTLLKQFLENFSLLRVSTGHNTYHHFLGQGLYDSDIDVLLHTDEPGVSEEVIGIICKHDHPDMLSHHDMIMSQCSFPAMPSKGPSSDDLITAPRLPNTRHKIVWSPEGAAKYEELVGPALRKLRKTWLDPTSTATMSILLQMTNHVLSNAASASNKAVNLSSKPVARSVSTPRCIRTARKRLRKQHKEWKRAHDSHHSVSATKANYTSALKNYKRTVRAVRLEHEMDQDGRLLTILSDNPSSLYSFIRASKNTSQTLIEKLTVQDKVYLGDKVADGFYDAMTSLKNCDETELLSNPVIADQFSNYDHISKLCLDGNPIPPISLEDASGLLKRLKKNVKDFFSITALHYLNAGKEGVEHFQALMNAVLQEVENATIVELNVALGLILYKGHRKDKTSERSYRTISTCPFLSKAIDLYIRNLHQEKWDSCQASTQYQGSGSSHELASLLVTEVIQHSLFVANKPVFILALDAKSAFDRCLRQILVCELFKAGINDEALTLIDNRLASRSTVYEWNKELLGPAPDKTGFEQGGINSSDFYKLYNNEQLETAQSSDLGVDLGSIVISAVGQADDVMLCSNTIESLMLLVTLTESYCTKYRVKLVPSKTKLLGYSTPHKKHLLDHAKLINPVTIDGQPVLFTDEAEHVGVLRNTAGNMPNIMNRIAEHKSGLSFILSAGLARGRHGNPAASLKVHELYGTPKLFSGLATLVLKKTETSVIDAHFQDTIVNLQRLHDKTPRCFVFLMAGCLPGEAILHQKQLTIFMMICHLPEDPLFTHARHVLMFQKKSANSWFQQIRSLCLLYGLDHPLHLLDCPPTKLRFKHLVKEQISSHWEARFKEEATRLTSLHYFVPNSCSLNSPHPIWKTATSSSFECRKAGTLAKMMSGRFRSEYLCRHWSKNKQGYCLAETCDQTVGDLEHLLLHCQALSPVRERLWCMMFEHSVGYPALYDFLLRLEKSPPHVKMQFILDPTAFLEILEIWDLFGQQAVDHVYYLTRTYAYYLYRQKQILLGHWTSDNLRTKYNKKKVKSDRQVALVDTNLNIISGNSAMDPSALSHTQPLSYTSTYPTIPMHEQEHALQNIPVVPLLPALLPATTSVSYPEQNSVLAAQSSACVCCRGAGCDVCTDGHIKSASPNQEVLTSLPDPVPPRCDLMPDPVPPGSDDMPDQECLGVSGDRRGSLRHGSQQPHS